MATVRCDHCGALIQDSATMVDHGGLVYCCANCAKHDGVAGLKDRA